MSIFNRIAYDFKNQLQTITITTEPSRTLYLSGELFDTSGMIVTIAYVGGVSKQVSNYNITPDVPLTSDVSEIIISYTESGKTVFTTLPITIIPVDTVLDNNNWDIISFASSVGTASNYWSIGDCKAIAINGAVGTITVNATYYAYIIGFNHNGATNTIDFGTFKSISDNADICFADSNRKKTSTDGTKYFNMNHSSASCAGGWKGCDLRYDILGSTKTKNSDAVSDTATNPVPNTLMAALPADLRAVMKPMTIYTDNVGKTYADSNITASIDYLPLLAEFEVFGGLSSTVGRANPAESNYLERYEYYKLGNTKMKHPYDYTKSSDYLNWFLRSPYFLGIGSTALYSGFCLCDDDGQPTASSKSSSSYGVAPIFRV